MNKLFLPLSSPFFPYLVQAQTNINDNFNRCGYGGSCPYFNDDRAGFWGGMMGGNMMGWSGAPFMGWFGIVIMLLFWFLLIFGIVYLVKYLLSNTRTDPGKTSMPIGDDQYGEKEDQAVILLRKRFARGDIDKVEFEEKMKYLRKL